MTVININNISGIASVNAQSNSLELFDNTGASLLDLNANTATFPGGISVGGTVTYDDVTNIDSVGVITARSGIHVTSGSVGIGTNNPASIFHLNSSSTAEVKLTLQNTGGTTAIYGNNDDIIMDADKYRIRNNNGSTEYIRILSNGNIGIGTNNPTELVTVGSAVTTALLEIKPQLGAIDVNVSSGDFAPHYQDNFVIYKGQPGSGTERFRISPEGIITKPYQVAFFAYGSNGDTDLTAGTKFQFDTIPSAGGNRYVAVDTNHTTYNSTNVFDTTNYRFTAPVAGLYHFTVAMYFRRTGDPMTAIVPYVNNAQVVNGNNDVFFFSNQDIYDGQTLCGSVTLQLAANDYVSVHRRGGQSGTTRIYGPHSHFCGHLIG